MIAPLDLPACFELPSGRARLEPLEERHAAGVLKLVQQDPDLWRFMVTPMPRTLDDARAWLSTALEGKAKGTAFPFAVIDRAGGEVAGSTRYLDIQPLHNSIEIGWTFYGKDARRTAVNTECKLMLMTHAFESLGCVRVQLQCHASNERSRRAIMRLGASFEGVLRRNRLLHDGTYRDTAYFSVILREWPAVKERLQGFLLR